MATKSATVPERLPPAPSQLVEAMLFMGGPLPAEAIAQRLRGVDADQIAGLVDDLNRRYRAHGRPYHVVQQNDGYVLTLRPNFRFVRERMERGLREVRLSPATIEVLAIVAYRQPITKPDVDALRGQDSGAPLRHLVRLGLVQVSDVSPNAGATHYATTPRFLDLFQLPVLDDLPRTADLERL